MATSARASGIRGEALAEDFLIKNGYRILERNYRTRFGEIDIIAAEGEIIAFIEVKLRKSATFGTAGEAIDRRKQMQIAGVARHFLAARRLEDASCRFDSVLIVAGDADGSCECQLLKDAFRLD